MNIIRYLFQIIPDNLRSSEDYTENKENKNKKNCQ